MDSITWSVLSTVANLLMALFALIAIWQNRKQLLELKKQYNEDSRARLLFEVVSDRGLILLKITNVGKETAYNTRLNIKSEMIDNHFSKHIRQRYNQINELCSTIVSGKSLYYLISPNFGSESSFQTENENFDSSVTNKWLDKYLDCPIYIKGSYCRQYTIDENLTINSFMAGGSMIVVDGATLALQEISKGLSCKNNNHRPIQENIEEIKKSINQISNVNK